MKKIIIILIIFFLYGQKDVHTSYVFYPYKEKIYKIEVPQNVEYYKLEREYLNNNLTKNNKYYKLVKLNILLIKLSLTPIFN